MVVRHEVLTDVVKNIFQALGVPASGAALIADVLVAADLRGVYSHGVVRVEEYANKLRGGGWSPQGPFTIERQTGSVALVNGHNGVGILTAIQAMELAIDMAKRTGVGVVSVKGGGHFGCAAYYAMMAQKSDMIGIALTNASPGMAPTGGADPILGNNPWSVAIPGGEEGGIVLDMANSVVTRGKIRLAAKKGEKIPLGWALDANGFPTEDPKAALAGSLLAIGDYKGYGITLAVDLLAGVLSGAAYGPHVGSPRDPGGKQDVGHMMMAIDVVAIQPKEAFKRRVSQYIREVKSSELGKGSQEILVPGEPEYRKEREQRARGLNMSDPVMRQLIEIADALKVPIPQELRRKL